MVYPIPTVTWIAIDPGNRFTGLSVFTFDRDLKKLSIPIAYTVSTLKYEFYGELAIQSRLDVINTHLELLLHEYIPNYVVCESAFMHRFPMAFGRLSQQIQTMKDTVSRYNPFIQFILFSPKEARKISDIYLGISNKEKTSQDIRNLLISEACITPVDIMSLDDHALDSIGIGIAFYLSYLK